MHLWSCHCEAKPPAPPPTPRAVPLGCFDVRNQSLLWCRHFGSGSFTIIPRLIQSSHHQITSKHLQETTILKKKKKIQSFLSVLHVSHVMICCMLLKFSSGKKWLLLHNTGFFHLRLILSLFWALISCVSSARPFPTLHLSSIIHNPQLFLPSHNTTYLQTIIFLFWNVWNRGLPCCCFRVRVLRK